MGSWNAGGDAGSTKGAQTPASPGVLGLLAVDDLGAGYAGLSSFSTLEPDFVKLDMSLIRDVDSSPKKMSVVSAMIQLCKRDLGSRVICEGVETVSERDALAAVGADLLQGYLFARPDPDFQPPRW